MSETSVGIDWRKFGREIAIMALAALVLALLGPFGMFGLPLSERLINWTLFMLGGYLCFRPVMASGRALAAQTGVPHAVALAVACAFAALPTTLLVVWILAGRSWADVSLGSVAELYPQVLIVGAVVAVLQRLSDRAGASAEQPLTVQPDEVEDAASPATEQAESRDPIFFDRLPIGLGRKLLCLQNEDHYVRVHTDLGSALVLIRMSDAVDQLAEFDGARVHRGWWVARSAVTEVCRRDRAVTLKLANGLEAPVARNAVPALRSNGWFDL